MLYLPSAALIAPDRIALVGYFFGLAVTVTSTWAPFLSLTSSPFPSVKRIFNTEISIGRRPLHNNLCLFRLGRT